MKKCIFASITAIVLTIIAQQASATTLWQAYQAALNNDPTYKAALSTKMAAEETLPQSIAVLLPQVDFNGDAGYNNTNWDVGKMASGAGNIGPYNRTFNQNSTHYNLQLTQSIFNFAYWKAISAAKASVKSAAATYNYAAQDLMTRLSQAYFDVLQSKDVLRFTEAEKIALYNTYQQAYESYKVGVKTITDVYNAKATYDTSVSDYITAKNDVADRKEDLRTITNILYRKYSYLKTVIPLIKPVPANINKWVTTANNQNWSLIASRYTTQKQKENIQVERSGHLPTLDLDAQYDNLHHNTRNVGNDTTANTSAEVMLNLPIFQGGMVNSKTREAIANYETATNNMVKTSRSVTNDTRQSYLGVVADISTVQANQQSVISTQSSLDSTKEGYKVGTNTMVDVLLAEKTYYNSLKTYAISRYKYIMDLVRLKEAAGTLSDNDIRTLNNWLTATRPKDIPSGKTSIKPPKRPWGITSSETTYKKHKTTNKHNVKKATSKKHKTANKHKASKTTHRPIKKAKSKRKAPVNT